MASELLRLRILVAALGESAKAPWWRTQFLSAMNLRTVTRLFPRSAVRAAILATSRAAGEAHDRHVGGPGRWHLFRLPAALEAEAEAATKDHETAAALAGLLEKDTAGQLVALKELAGRATPHTAPGPVRAGPTDLLSTTKGCQELAGHYLAAFIAETKTFPFFEDATRRRA